MKLTVLTLFPESLASMLDASILGRARSTGLVEIECVDMRAFSTNKHRTVDDTPAGGGAGMILRVDVVKGAIASVPSRTRTILVDARGRPFAQSDARRYAREQHLVIVCGRYEGVDARAERYVDEVVSLGDFVLTGGEIAALAIVDATVRLLRGVLGNAASSEHESHGVNGLLEHRQYTRPIEYDGASVPAILQSGNHKLIEKARSKDSLIVTRERRPDLLVHAKLSKADDASLRDDAVSTLAPERAP
ncbi:MAG TPA: tRNA (guanosine(37)-N1)-methyltransferase TrmD [Myxococcota bacterium]|jgi:tRNA (guanine37-N1)-methyltransferase